MPEPSSEVTYKSVKRFPGYRIGTDGSAWTCWTRFGAALGHGEGLRIGKLWTKLKPNRLKQGYQQVTLYRSGKSYYHRTHQMVLTAFVGPCPAGMVGRHLDGNPENNDLSNLVWSTQSVNLADRNRHGTNIVGTRNGRAKVTEEDVIEIRQRYAAGRMSQQTLADEFGLNQTNVSDIIRRVTWKHVP